MMSVRASKKIFWISLLIITSLTLSLVWNIHASATTLTYNPKLIGITEQNGDRVMIMDANATDWNSSQALVWSWKPTAANGFDSLLAAWGLPTDLKIRNNSVFGGQWAIVTDSEGLAAIVPYPSGNSKKWGLNVGGNPQSAELLPNGNIAIAASQGNWVRVYTSALHPSSDTYASYTLPGARGVMWDPLGNVLWAIGDNHLVALLVGGSRSAPVLTEYLKVNLPTTGGRDVQPVYGDTDKLWVPTNSGVYQYNKTTNTFSTSYSGSGEMNRANVRSAGSDLITGQAAQTTPKVGCSNSWCTDTVDFFAPGMTRTLTGAAIYKAHFINLEYQQPESATAVVFDHPIGGGDQKNDKIMFFDPNATEWNDPSSIIWEWAPSAANGFSGLTNAFGDPSDLRLRKSDVFGGQWLVIADSKGLAAVVPYPAGNSKQWGVNVGGNPHAAELLPNGNVAVAASHGHWVRIYTASQGPDSAEYAQYDLTGAHGVLWDPEKSLLWALGDYHLVALSVNGTDDAPTIQEVLKVDLPQQYRGNGDPMPNPSGHELQPVYGNTDRLWISTAKHVYQYVKSTNTFDSSYAGSAGADREAVKSVSNQLSGQIISTQPDYAKVPVGACVFNGWCTDSVDFVNPTYTRTLTGAAFYKVRVMNPAYQ